VFEEIHGQFILNFLQCLWFRNSKFFCSNIRGVCTNSAL